MVDGERSACTGDMCSSFDFAKFRTSPFRRCGMKVICSGADNRTERSGSAAIFNLVGKPTGGKFVERMKNFARTGKVLQAFLRKDNEDALRRVF